jgi:hypothetical protein
LASDELRTHPRLRDLPPLDLAVALRSVLRDTTAVAVEFAPNHDALDLLVTAKTPASEWP